MATPNKKRKLDEDASGCMVHCTDSSDALVTLDSLKSWNTLVDAAQIRQNQRILEIAQNHDGDDVPFVQYHRNCRSVFTMKRDLEKLKLSQSQVIIFSCSAYFPTTRIVTYEAISHWLVFLIFL